MSLLIISIYRFSFVSGNPFIMDRHHAQRLQEYAQQVTDKTLAGSKELFKLMLSKMMREETL
jgi:hypothetical protein